MTIAKFYVSTEELNRGQVVLKGQQHHHLSRVLRIRRGRVVTVMDGKGLVGLGKVSVIDSKQAIVTIEEVWRADPEFPRLHLYQALTRMKKMDIAVQNAAEIGAVSLTPFGCTRSSPLEALDGAKMGRLRRIAMEASRLSGRPYLMEVREPLPWDGLLDDLARMNIAVYADEESGDRPSSVLDDDSFDDIGLLVGPEGGFADAERDSLAIRGVRAVTLGKTIFRTETAGLVLLAAVKCHYHRL